MGCYKRHLYVQQEWVNANYLASSKVRTPDPRQEHPPIGQNLLVAWDFPKSLFQRNLTLVATVCLWNITQKVITYPIERMRDCTSFFFANDTPGSDQRILTYRIQIFTADGELVETWEHHFWTELIDIDRRDSFSSAERIKDSVSSQLMQESVIDTP